MNQGGRIRWWNRFEAFPVILVVKKTSSTKT